MTPTVAWRAWPGGQMVRQAGWSAGGQGWAELWRALPQTRLHSHLFASNLLAQAFTEECQDRAGPAYYTGHREQEKEIK